MRIQNISMAGAVALVGVGLIAHSAALVFSSFGNSAQADVGVAAPAVASAAMAQGGGEPTIVWYGTVESNFFGTVAVVLRAWSDGTIELKRVNYSPNPSDVCNGTIACSSPWIVVSSPNDGLAAVADINADQQVDAQDLSQVLSRWGDAPRNDIPPSDCPLNLVNP